MAEKNEPAGEDQEFASQLVAEADDYASAEFEEGLGEEPLRASMLSPELKASMGLDAFPEDIQDAILDLARRVADYSTKMARALSSGEEATWAQRASGCMASMPSHSIMRDAWRNQNRVGQLGNFAGRLSPGLKRYALPLRIGAFGATALGGAAGHFVGCMQMSGRMRR